MAARKRSIEEVDRLDLLTRPVQNASLHAAVTSLSSVKKGRNSNYFDGTYIIRRPPSNPFGGISSCPTKKAGRLLDDQESSGCKKLRSQTESSRWRSNGSNSKDLH